MPAEPLTAAEITAFATRIDPEMQVMLPSFARRLVATIDARDAKIERLRGLLGRCRHLLDYQRYILDDGHTVTEGSLAVEIDAETVQGVTTSDA